MADSDFERERERLQRVYSGMTDEELQTFASDSASLTAEAIQALGSEIARRKLDINIPSSSGEDSLEQRELVTIRRFQTLSEALIARSALESAGIESFLLDDNTARVYTANTVGGIRLQVDKGDEEAAAELLNQTIPDSSEPPENDS